MSKPTPGPWTLHWNQNQTQKGDFVIHADCREFKLRPLAYIESCGNSEFSQANARLIAAAPELLEALKQAVARLEAEYTPSPLDGDAALLRKLRAAISKAENRE